MEASLFRAPGPSLANGAAAPLAALAYLRVPDLQEEIAERVASGWRVAAYFGERSEAGETRLSAVLALDEAGRLEGFTSVLQGDELPSFTDRCAQVHLFERELAEQFGLRLSGHPWPVPAR